MTFGQVCMVNDVWPCIVMIAYTTFNNVRHTVSRCQDAKWRGMTSIWGLQFSNTIRFQDYNNKDNQTMIVVYEVELIMFRIAILTKLHLYFQYDVCKFSLYTSCVGISILLTIVTRFQHLLFHLWWIKIIFLVYANICSIAISMSCKLVQACSY